MTLQELSTIKITSTFNGILQIDNIGIKAYDLNYIPTRFNIFFENDSFIIINGDDYNTYEWQTDYILEELNVLKSIIHLDMNLQDIFNLNQQNATVYMFSTELTLLNAYLKNSNLITKGVNIKHIHLYMNDSIVKGPFVSYLMDLKIKYNSACYINIEHCKIIPRLKIDNSSLLYINEELMNWKSKI
jgi:hypothetical protein